MKSKTLLLVAAMVASSVAIAGGNLHSNDRSAEVTFIKDNKRMPDVSYQAHLRQSAPWQNYLQSHGTWYVTFNEENAKPHRAYGKPIQTAGSDAQSKALNFINNFLTDFDIPVGELNYMGADVGDKLTYVNFFQEAQGLKVLFSRMTVKMDNNDRVIMWGADVYPNINIDIVPTITEAAAKSVATNGINETITSNTVESELFILPIPENKNNVYKLVYKVNVETMGDDGIPSNYHTLVDAHSGEIHYRQNMVMHHDHGGHNNQRGGNIDVHTEATVYTTHTYDPSSVEPLPNMDVTINSNNYMTDGNGDLSTTETGPASATFTLSGSWSTIYRNNQTPSFTTTLNGGANTVSFDSDALVQERSAYYHVNTVHDYHKTWLPAFTGMDISLTTNVDLTTGDCNAFYNGSSINFYADGNGCLTYANVADVVYHEYGHGINDKYYQSQSSIFQNGGMNEGYADVWAFAITENPLLGVGGDAVDPTGLIRRYDIDPKVYPVDLVGQVHADGEIIAGAWWDTYLNLGSDMNATMALFRDAYPGLQAATPNGNEGQAFTEVLLDVLQADDDDADITNGTPNGIAIHDAFALHGIYLLSNATLNHTAILEEDENVPVTIDADLTLTFPFSNYLNDVLCFYKVNTGAWNQVPMNNVSGNNYTVDIPAQPVGTLISYYLGVDDNVFADVAAVTPIGAADTPYPGLPNYILVGCDLEATDDVGDFVSEFPGNWSLNQPGDNNTTGDWEVTVPIGSFSDLNGDGNPDTNDPDALVQPDYQHTPGGDICFVTGNANSTTDGIGTNDVDGGHATLTTPTIDLSSYTNPIFSYWRWYTNNPPSGANPGADWWQVAISDDGGSSWASIENTVVGQREWRRNAFRVNDYVTATNNVQIRFIVSDSIHIGQNLDGGSLIEAALDDIQLWDDASADAVDDLDANSIGLNVYPNPVTTNATMEFSLPISTEVTFSITNAIGQIVLNKDMGKMTKGNHQLPISAQGLSDGVYMINLTMENQVVTKRITIAR
jgi:hypothetical protein